MRPVPYCMPDILRMVLHAAGLVSEDGFIHRKVLLKVMGEVVDRGDFDSGSVELAFKCLKTAYKALGVKDPYDNIKARRTKAMLGLEKSFRDYIDASADMLMAAINLSMAASINRNACILGRTEAEREIFESLGAELARDDRGALANSLAHAEKVVYILDSAGEIVIDRLFVEQIANKAHVQCVVASEPILDIATVGDAQAAGFEELQNVTLIEPGAAMLGLTLEKASSSFREVFAAADTVIARGEYNFQTLGRVDREVFFMLNARCPAVSAMLGVEEGGNVVACHTGKSSTGRFEAVGAGKRPSGRKK